MNKINGEGFYVQSIHTENTGGGTMIDFVTLTDGRVLGIGDGCVVLYKNIDEFWDATPTNKQRIDL